MPNPSPDPMIDEASFNGGDPFEETRMSFGDHLDELRSCVIKALAGCVVGAIICLYFAKHILMFIYQPVLVVQHAAGLRPWLQALSPTAPFLAYLKIGIMTGIIVAMPWVIYQVWSFIATGLYPRERKFVRRMIPASCGLFALGVVFLYYVVLPVVLQFFVSFNTTFPLPDLEPHGLQKVIVGSSGGSETTTGTPPDGASTNAMAPNELPIVPVLDADPPNPQVGQWWIHKPTSQLHIRTPDGVRFVALEALSAASAVHSQFAIDFYVSFVLMLALAFGIAFELPIVVFFLAWSGLVSTSTMRGARRYVLLVIVILAAILTPPDVISQLMLAVPMYGLFELGLLVGRSVEKGGAERT